MFLRMKSIVQPTGRPLAYTGIQLVMPWTLRSAPTAIRQRTFGSSSSSSPPTVKPISGKPLSASHLSEIRRIWLVSSRGASR